MDEYDRRSFIRTSLPGLLGVTMALPALIVMATRANAHEGRIQENGFINWDAFLTGIEKEAAKQHLDNWNEEEYVKRASAIMRRLNIKDPGLKEAFTKAKMGVGNGLVDFVPLIEKKKDYHVTLLQFETGEEISHHDHPEMTGVILNATGEIEVWNYDILAEREDKKDVLLQQTNYAMLGKGEVSTLTSKARNIHRLKAKTFTQLIDIFAPPYDKEKIEKSTWFDVDPEGYKGKLDIYQAKRKK